MIRDQLGANYAQPDYSKIQILPLSVGVDASLGVNSGSYVFPKKGMRIHILIRLVDVATASYDIQLQQKQNGAWAAHPGLPAVKTVTADGLIRLDAITTDHKEVRVAITENGGGTPVGFAYVDLLL